MDSTLTSEPCLDKTGGITAKIRPFNEEEKGRAREREYRNRSETFDTRLNREIRDRSINRDSRDDLYNDDLGIFDCD